MVGFVCFGVLVNIIYMYMLCEGFSMLIKCKVGENLIKMLCMYFVIYFGIRM